MLSFIIYKNHHLNICILLFAKIIIHKSRLGSELHSSDFGGGTVQYMSDFIYYLNAEKYAAINAGGDMLDIGTEYFFKRMKYKEKN